MLRQINENKNVSVVPLLTTGKASNFKSGKASLSIKGPLKVMSYNIHYGVGRDSVHSVNRIAKVIKESGADIVGLNEVDNGFSQRSQFVNQAKLLADNLNMHHVFGAAISKENYETGYGNVILSRYKPDNIQNYMLPTKEGEESRACLSAEFSINGKKIKFFVTHLHHKDNELRKKQIDSITEIAAGPIASIITGDFNHAADISQLDTFWAGFKKRFHSAFDLAGTGDAETFYGAESKIIDFVFISNQLAHCVQKSYVLRSKTAQIASDHLPLIAEIMI